MVLKIKEYCGIRLIGSLILFFGLAACSTQDQRQDPVIEWDNEKAMGVFVPYHLVKDTPEDVLFEYLTVHLSGPGNPAIPGETKIHYRKIFYAPVIPFTRGLAYEIRLRGEMIAMFEVPLPDLSEAPELISVFPSADTVPENLLKFYFQFSKSMREGQALEHIALLKNGRDTLSHVFLDLRPELWDGEGKQLTLWLDPGRIKRDLQPHSKMGMPLEKGITYRLVVDDRWRDTQGLKLAEKWSKDFFVGHRDDASPSLEEWTIIAPESGTFSSLQVQFNEPLDYAVAYEAINVTFIDSDSSIPGLIELEKKESALKFTPAHPWIKGMYRLRSAARLEDLAGNNLERLFDHEVSTPEIRSSREYYSKPFKIE